VGTAAGFSSARWWDLRPDRVRDNFHLLFHKNGATTYNNTYWHGVNVQKSPLDLWVYQEILSERKPDVLIECGTYKGGSAFYFANLMDQLGRGRIITIDIEKQPNLPQHPRITYLEGSSVAPESLAKIRALLQPGETVMVSLDSDHHKDHVLKELELYHPLVTPGQYLVVEDTHMGGHPILPSHGPGPLEAVQAFLAAGNRPFEVDHTREKFLMSFNRGGYLLRR